MLWTDAALPNTAWDCELCYDHDVLGRHFCELEFGKVGGVINNVAILANSELFGNFFWSNQIKLEWVHVVA